MDVTAVKQVIGCHLYRSVFLLSTVMRVMDGRHEGTSYPCTACYLSELSRCAAVPFSCCTYICIASALTTTLKYVK